MLTEGFFNFTYLVFCIFSMASFGTLTFSSVYLVSFNGVNKVNAQYLRANDMHTALA